MKIVAQNSEYASNKLNFIIENNLRSGFDLSTGTGISALSMGLGMKETNGNVLSVDSYVEVEESRMVVHKSEQSGSYESESFIQNKNLIELFGLENHVDLRIGVSPHDCKEFLLGREKLDIVFFDCPKNEYDFHRDASYVKEHLNENKFAIFWHDTHVFMDDFKRLSLEYFNVESVQLYEFKFGENTFKQQFPLSLITNIENY